MLGDVAFSADKTFGQATANIPAPIIHRCSVLIKSIFSISGYEYTMKKGHTQTVCPQYVHFPD